MKVLVKPILTEKASSTNEKGIFVFMVEKNANKIQIRKAVESTYNVKVIMGNRAVIAFTENGKKNKTSYTRT